MNAKWKSEIKYCRDITIMQTKVTPRQKMKRQVNFIFLANCISQTMDKEMWISVLKQWRIEGMGPGTPSPPPPPLFPLFFRPNWGLKGRKKFFWRPSPLPPQAPPLFEGLNPLLLCLISLVHSKNQAANQMTYHDVIRTASNSLDCRRARHCASTVPRKLPKECQTKLLKKFGDLNLERY